MLELPSRLLLSTTASWNVKFEKFLCCCILEVFPLFNEVAWVFISIEHMCVSKGLSFYPVYYYLSLFYCLLKSQPPSRCCGGY
jgi:hypothetical protein